MQRSKQIKTNSPSFNLRLIYPLFIPLCLCSYQNKQIENHPNGILPSPNLWNTRLYIFQKGCSRQKVWNILKLISPWLGYILYLLILQLLLRHGICQMLTPVRFPKFSILPEANFFEQVPFATNTLSVAALWIFRSKLNNTTFFWHHRILGSISFQLQKESLHWKEKC